MKIYTILLKDKNNALTTKEVFASGMDEVKAIPDYYAKISSKTVIPEIDPIFVPILEGMGITMDKVYKAAILAYKKENGIK